MRTLFILITAAVLTIFFFKINEKHEIPLKAALINMLTGASALIAAGLIFSAPAVNYYTAFAALTLGLPGVGLMVILSFVMV